MFEPRIQCHCERLKEEKTDLGLFITAKHLDHEEAENPSHINFFRHHRPLIVAIQKAQVDFAFVRLTQFQASLPS